MRITFDGKEKQRAIARVVLTAEKETIAALTPNGAKEIRIGVGRRDEVTRRKLFLIARQVIVLSKAHRAAKIVIQFSDFIFPQLKIEKSELAEIMATQFVMANFEFVKYKTPPKEGWHRVLEVIVSGVREHEVKKGFERGLLVGAEVNGCRVLSNTPGGEMTPSVLAREAERAVKGTSAKVKILGASDIKKLGMGGIMGVAQGSSEEPRFIIIEYRGGAKSEKPIVLIGKGVTFDTGGLNLKPTQAIYEMHMDMTGGAAVIHTIALVARLKFKKNVIGLIPAVENMPSGSSYRPGDVLKTMSGKTIEVLNTDAEGRIILADATTYAKRYHPRLVIDVATLTGAAMVALGQRASAIFSKDETLIEKLRATGERVGEYVWPLPLWDEFEDDIKGTFGDVANDGKTKYGGAIQGAMFIYQFAKDLGCPWAHIDIAPRMTAVDGEYLAKGATGEPVKLLASIVENI